mgnify:CR=1 FL=1
MSLATVASRALAGIDAPEVAVEVHLGPGLPSFTIVGLPDAEVREATLVEPQGSGDWQWYDPAAWNDLHGIGMVLIVPAKRADEALRLTKGIRIGEIIAGSQDVVID